MSTVFNVWTPAGTVVTSVTKGYGNPTVIYDINPVILTGNTNVFKMWYGDYVAGVLYYAESVDGLTSWTQYSGNPISLAGSVAFPTVYKSGSTYYLYCTPGNGNTGTIVCYTSSDGVTSWTSKGVVLSRGTTGLWDASAIAQLTVCDIMSGTWYAYYNGFGPEVPQLGGGGLITSTDGLTWTKAVGNPLVINSNGNPGPGVALTFLKAGSTYYCYSGVYWNNSKLTALGHSAVFRWSAPSPSGPWTQLTYQGNQIPTYYPASPQDYPTGGYAAASNIGDLSMVSANGNIYLYYDLGVGTAGAEGTINQAVATGYTTSQLVATYEGVINAPLSGFPQLNTVTLGSDNFQRANGTLGANWTTIATSGNYSAAQIVSHLVERNATASADSWYNAATWGNPQWSQVTVAAITATNAGVGAACFQNVSGVASEYTFQWNGILGNTGTTVAFKKVVSGTATALFSSSIGLALSAGDAIMGVAYYNGTTTQLLLYWNGYCIFAFNDTTFTSGAAGLQIAANTAANNAQLSAWSGGGFNSGAVPIPSTASGNAYMMLMGCGQ